MSEKRRAGTRKQASSSRRAASGTSRSSRSYRSSSQPRAAVEMRQSWVSFDFVLLGIVAILIGLGLVMVFSASYSLANDFFEDSTYYLMRQLRWLIIGTTVMVAAALFDYRQLRRLSVAMMVVTMVLLLAVLLIGGERLGATRFLGRNGSIQPSELAKLTITIYIAYWLTSKGDRLRHVSYGLLPFAVLLGLVAGLIILQPDFDTTVIIVVASLVMFFVAGADLRQLLISLVVAAFTLYFAIVRTSYASQRITDFVVGLTDPLRSSDQVWKSVKALATGGLLGTGLGDAQSKFLGGVPLPWSDSIFAIIGEELGLIGTITVVVLFIALTFRGLRIALRSEDRFGLVLGCGLTAWLAFQAFTNMAVSTAMLPYSGQTLPFISYGGSSLVTCMAAVGILLSISRYGTRDPTRIRRGGEPASTGLPSDQGPQVAAPGRWGWNWWPRLSDLGRARGVPGPERGRSTSRAISSFTVKSNSASRAGALGRRVARTKRSIARRTGSARRKDNYRTAAGPRRIPRRR